MNDDEVRTRLRRLLQTQPLGVLATSGPESTHASLVAFAATGDLREIVFATGRATRKFEILKRNPRVALLVDDRSNEIRDFRDASAVTAQGLAALVDAGRLEEFRRLYLDRHPYLAEFVHAPSCSMVTIAVETYDLVGNFQEVHTLRVPDGLGTPG